MTDLGAGASEIGAEHDGPGGRVRKLLSAGLEAIFEELDITATAVAAVLVLYFVLDDQRLIGKVDGRLEGRRDGVVSSLRLGHETLVAVDDRLRGLLDLPLSDVAESLSADGSLLCRLGDRPPLGPVVRELLEERSLDCCGLSCTASACALRP